MSAKNAHLQTNFNSCFDKIDPATGTTIFHIVGSPSGLYLINNVSILTLEEIISKNG